MLEAGAKVGRENCVGRTASQMAAFVGMSISSVVNKFHKTSFVLEQLSRWLGRLVCQLIFFLKPCSEIYKKIIKIFLEIP